MQSLKVLHTPGTIRQLAGSCVPPRPALAPRTPAVGTGRASIQITRAVDPGTVEQAAAAADLVQQAAAADLLKQAAAWVIDLLSDRSIIGSFITGYVIWALNKVSGVEEKVDKLRAGNDKRFDQLEQGNKDAKNELRRQLELAGQVTQRQLRDLLISNTAILKYIKAMMPQMQATAVSAVGAKKEAAEAKKEAADAKKQAESMSHRVEALEHEVAVNKVQLPLQEATDAEPDASSTPAASDTKR